MFGFSQLCLCFLPHGLRAEQGLPHNSNKLLSVDEHIRKQEAALYYPKVWMSHTGPARLLIPGSAHSLVSA